MIFLPNLWAVYILFLLLAKSIIVASPPSALGPRPLGTNFTALEYWGLVTLIQRFHNL